MTEPGAVVGAGPISARTVAAGTGTRPALGAVRRTVREVGLAMIVGGVVVLLFVGYQLFGTNLTEHRAQSVLAHAFQAAQRQGGAPAVAATGSDPATVQPAAGAAPDLSPSTPQGSAIEHLVIPSIGVDSYVVQGTNEQDLMKGPGHYVDTPFPGQKGNAAIAGHRTTYGAPFFRLNELHLGDRIWVTNAKGKTFVFSVLRHLIADPTGPSAAAVLADTSTAELTLTTCNPRFEAVNRLIVVAALVGPAATEATASPTRATAASAVAAPSKAAPSKAVSTKGSAVVAAASLGNGNTAGWPPGIAYGALFVALWVGTRLAVNRTRGWRRAGAFVVGIAVCAVPLWFCFENVVRLLPQSI